MRRATFVLPLILIVVACGPQLAPGASAQAQRSAQVTPILDGLLVLSQTAINLNAIPSGQPGHLGDNDTRHVRDAALAITDGCTAYVSSGSPVAIQAAVNSFGAKLTANAKASVTLKAVWSIVQIQINIIIPALANPMGGV